MTEHVAKQQDVGALETENERLRRALERAGSDGLSLGLHHAGSDTHRQDLAIPVSHLDELELAAELRVSRAALAASEERLAFAVEASGSLGWWDWDIPGDRVYAGEKFARMFGVDVARAASGAPLDAFVEGIHAEDRGWVAERIQAALTSGGSFSEEYRLVGRDGSPSWVYARGHCYHDGLGRPSRFPGVALDITDRKANERRKDALLELGERLRGLDDPKRIAAAAAQVMAGAIGAVRAGFGSIDEGHESVLIETDWCAPGTRSIAGRHRFRDYGSFIDDLVRGELVHIGDVTSDARTRADSGTLLALDVRVLVNVPIVERGRLVAIVFVHHDAPHDWSVEELAFIRAVADRTQAAMARAQAEAHQQVLNTELGHRLKNTLAMVQAIATQTLRNASNLEGAREDLNARLIALGKAHDILLVGGGEHACITNIVEGALALHADREGRLEAQGPEFGVNPSAALSLSLILHELATNAAKYGALSRPDGRVAVVWSVSGAGLDAVFALTWTEMGGPPVVPPSRKGFGSRLIERGLFGAGTVALDYRPEGLACRLTTSLAGFEAGGP